MIHTTGEEFLSKIVFTGELSRPESVDVLLFDNSVDQLAPDDDIDAIETEPAGTAYSRQTAMLDTGGFSVLPDASGFRVEAAPQAFDTEDATRSIDAVAICATFASETTDDASPSDHLLFSNELVESYDLATYDRFSLVNSGVRFN